MGSMVALIFPGLREGRNKRLFLVQRDVLSNAIIVPRTEGDCSGLPSGIFETRDTIAPDFSLLRQMKEALTWSSL